jgi:hypothetical protein
MLRGLTGSPALVTRAPLFDILKLKLLCFLKNASGNMTRARGVLARDQVAAGFGGYFSDPESGDLGSDARYHAHDSQICTLRARQQLFTQRQSPRSKDRGPIEGRLRCPALPE